MAYYVTHTDTTIEVSKTTCQLLHSVNTRETLQTNLSTEVMNFFLKNKKCKEININYNFKWQTFLKFFRLFFKSLLILYQCKNASHINTDSTDLTE